MGKEKNNFFTLIGSLIVLLLLLITSKNLIYLFVLPGVLMLFLFSIFKTKNLDYKLYYACIAPILVLQGLLLFYIYLFKSIYLYDVYWIVYFVFIGIFLVSVLTWAYYLIYRRNS